MKTAIITGASRGIGKATAKLFAENGYNVVICYNRSDHCAEELERELKNKGFRALSIKVDVALDSDIKELFEKTYNTFGSVDVLVNNAGVSSYNLLHDVSNDEFDLMTSVNFGGAFKTCREAIPYMLKSHHGSIVNVSSVWGVSGASCEAVYSATKAAVIGLTKALSKELGPSGIRVNCVAPGVIDTDMNSHHTEETMASLANEASLCRIGKPEEVAEAIYFLASEKSSFITGQVLTVDGGFI